MSDPVGFAARGPLQPPRVLRRKMDDPIIFGMSMANTTSVAAPSQAYVLKGTLYTFLSAGSNYTIREKLSDDVAFLQQQSQEIWGKARCGSNIP